MKFTLKPLKMTAALAAIGCVIIPQTALAAGPITIEGGVFDKGKPVPGLTVVAWCGGINFFGGSGTTDAKGHYVIHTDSDACPFDNELTVTTDTNGDGQSDGARHTQVHTSTVINIFLGSYTSVPVPEFGWLGAGVAAAAGFGAIGYVRRRNVSS